MGQLVAAFLDGRVVGQRKIRFEVASLTEDPCQIVLTMNSLSFKLWEVVLTKYLIKLLVMDMK